MEIGGVTNTSPAASSQYAARQDVSSQAGAVKTELARTQAVQQTAATPNLPVKFDLREDAKAAATRIAAIKDFVERRNLYDIDTRQIITRKVKVHTNEVVQQFPDDITLKLRAFVRDMSEAKKANDASESDVPHVTRVV